MTIKSSLFSKILSPYLYLKLRITSQMEIKGQLVHQHLFQSKKDNIFFGKCPNIFVSLIHI